MPYSKEKENHQTAKQIHKKFTTEQVKELLEKHINKEVERKYFQEILGVNKFFRTILARYPSLHSQGT